MTEKKPIPYGRQWLDDDDVAAVVQALRGDWLTTGPAVEAFEKALAERVGAKHVVAVNSGTAALHAAYFAAGVGPGLEVITTPITFAATSNAALYLGGKPVFVDVCRDTLNLDPELIEAAITARTRVLAPVDYAGHPADLDPIIEIARERGLAVVEDASHALGAAYRGRPIGSVAGLTTFSFHPVKHIATGEGGAVATNSDEMAERVHFFRNHGITSTFRDRERMGGWFYEMQYLGFNYRISDINCALGLSQLRKLDRFLARRREIAHTYDQSFADVAEVERPARRPEVEHAYHLYPIRLAGSAAARRKQVFQRLRGAGIGVNVHYLPVPWHPYYQRLGYQRGQWPVAEEAYERLLSLPMFPAMSDEEVGRVVREVCEAVR